MSCCRRRLWFWGCSDYCCRGLDACRRRINKDCNPSAHVAACLSRNPECLVNGVESIQEAQQFTKVNAVVIGPGLGKSSWSEQMLKVFLEVNVPIILDADALNLISDGNLGSLLAAHHINASFG